MAEKLELKVPCLEALNCKKFSVGRFEASGIDFGPLVYDEQTLAILRCKKKMGEEQGKSQFEVMGEITKNINEFEEEAIGVEDLIKESLEQHGKYFREPCEACRYAILNLTEDL